MVSNHQPFGYQPNALPLSYIPIVGCHGLVTTRERYTSMYLIDYSIQPLVGSARLELAKMPCFQCK